MIIQHNGDIFTAPIKILVHQCNCHVTMGAGIALKIKQRFPEAYEADLNASKTKTNILGNISIGVSKGMFIVNLYGQDGCGGRRNTNYEAYYSGLEKVKEFANKNDCLNIGIPYGMGCALGGGEWSICKSMIDCIFNDYSGNVLICKLR